MKDINKYDYLSVSVKTDSEDEMVTRYGVFGWELIERFDDKQFFDIAVIYVIIAIFKCPYFYRLAD